AVSGGEDRAAGRLLEDPIPRRVTGAVEVGAEPDEVVVHVDGDGGGRRDVGDLSLQAVDRAEVEARAAERLGYRSQEVATLAKILEVLREEGVVAVVPGGARVEAGEQVGVEQRGSGGCSHGHGGISKRWV